MEEMQTEDLENDVVPRTSRLLQLYRKRSCLQNMLRQHEIKLKLTIGMWLLFFASIGKDYCIGTVHVM